MSRTTLSPPSILLTLALIAAPSLSHAQSLGFSQSTAPGATPQPIQITASNGLEWNQKTRIITANGNAQAVRGTVTITADQLIAHYAANSTGPAAQPASSAANPGSDPLSGLDQGQSKLTRLEAVGNVHIFTKTEQAFADHAIYHMASGELVLTGNALRLTTPSDTITAAKSLQYWSKDRRAVAIGTAQVVTKNHRSIQADQLTGYFAARPTSPTTATTSSAGKLRKVIAQGHVIVRTATDIATGDHGVYRPATGIAVLTGNVHITRGPNELAGGKALVNMKTGIATLLAAPGHRVQGVVLPNSAPPALTVAPALTAPPAVKSPQSSAKSPP